MSFILSFRWVARLLVGGCDISLAPFVEELPFSLEMSILINSADRGGIILGSNAGASRMASLPAVAEPNLT
jgi:hypothetical protein